MSTVVWIDTPEEAQRLLKETQEKGTRAFFCFVASKVKETGDSWCGDCRYLQ